MSNSLQTGSPPLKFFCLRFLFGVEFSADNALHNFEQSQQGQKAVR